MKPNRHEHGVFPCQSDKIHPGSVTVLNHQRCTFLCAVTVANGKIVPQDQTFMLTSFIFNNMRHCLDTVKMAV